jgi:hypothetical protein
MAIIIFCQNMGGAIFLVAANSIFSNALRQQLEQRIGDIGIDPNVILHAGVHTIRNIVSGNQLGSALEAYTESISQVMYLGIGVSAATWAFAWGLGWTDVRVVKKLQALQSSGAEDDEAAEKNPAL